MLLAYYVLNIKILTLSYGTSYAITPVCAFT